MILYTWRTVPNDLATTLNTLLIDSVAVVIYTGPRYASARKVSIVILLTSKFEV